MIDPMLLSVLGAGAAGAVGAGAWMRRKNLHLWLPEYYWPSVPRPAVTDAEEPMHAFICVCDHYEPEWGKPGTRASLEKVNQWCSKYPEQFHGFRDSRGRTPQHSFFFPEDEYRPEYLDQLAELCHKGYGDVEIHLHHDHDTAAGLREKLIRFRDALHHRHGLLRSDPVTQEIKYGFIHGNWALCNSRPDGRWCGVDHELPVLMETGCYADFTFPSWPSDTQPGTINSVYYAKDTPAGRRAHESGVRSRVGVRPPSDSLLMVQGPLLLNWKQRKFGVLPRVENGDLHAGHGPTIDRLDLWMQAHVHVAGHPRWRFVKLHTHGCKAQNIDMWLGGEVQQFHADLAERARRNPLFRYYYVTAWELSQIIHLAERGLADAALEIYLDTLGRGATQPVVPVVVSEGEARPVAPSVAMGRVPERDPLPIGD